MIKIHSNFYYVQIEDIQYECMLRAKIKKAKIIPKVGDIVEILITDNNTGVIVDIKERKNELVKPNVSNIDQVIIVTSTYRPDFNSLILDKFLILYEAINIKPIICVNKSDLLDENLRKNIDYYSNIGYKLIFVSARTGEGINKLKDELIGKISILAGVSGVGKSSIINKIDNSLNLRIGDVSENLGVGTHTTRHVSLQIIKHKNKDCYIADTPGFSYIEFNNINSKNLSKYFREFEIYINDCKMKDCLHLYEDNCNLKNNIDTRNNYRYLNYLKFLEEVLKIEKEKKSYSNKNENKVKISSKANGKNIKIVKLSGELRDKNRKTINQNLKELKKIKSFEDIDIEI